MSRDVEVLREWLAKSLTETVGYWSTWPTEVRIHALRAAISALEEKEACPLCHQPQARHPGGVYCPKPPKSSSDSMEERLAAQDDLLYRILAAAGVAGTNAFGAIKACEDIVAMINAALHPHQPWCRGDHSEGPCLGDPMEVDREP